MKLIATDDIKKIDDQAINKQDQSKQSLASKLGAMVKKAIDCCIE